MMLLDNDLPARPTESLNADAARRSWRIGVDAAAVYPKGFR
jgi:hypothetical protein